MFDRFLNNCLLCGGCLSVCPNGVDVVSLIRGFRIDRSLKRRSYHLLRIVQGKDFDNISMISKVLRADKDIGGVLRLVTSGRNLPEVSREKIEYNESISEPSIAIFTGCISRIFYPTAVNILISLLRKEGFNVFIPQEQSCCGLMNYSAGDRKKAISLARANLEIFSSRKIEKIVTLCASCQYMLAEYRGLVEGGEIISDKIVLFSDIFADLIVRRIEEGGGRIGIHIPCHIRNRKDNRTYRLFKSLGKRSNVRIIDLCCGYGGVFNLYEYNKSLKIGERMIPQLKDIDDLYTSCSGCYMQIYDLVSRTKMDVQIHNLLEILRL